MVCIDKIITQEKKINKMKTKISKIISSLLILLVSLSLFQTTVSADVRLPHIFGDNMVLQRDMAIPIWGWAEADETITVSFCEQNVSARTDNKGQWKLKLAPVKAGGPYKMTITGLNKIQLNNILLGEVWLCSGQSNMYWPLNKVINANQEVAKADYLNIRFFKLPLVCSGQPLGNVNAKWQICEPKSAESFSAVAYFFGRKLHKDLNVPIGLIQSSWGGTRIEPWTPPAGFAQITELADIDRQIKKANTDYRKAAVNQLDTIEQWVADSRKALDELTQIPPSPLPEHPLNSHVKPTGLYNAMIHPLIPFAIRGAIWYQGESNRGDGMLYYHKMRALIGGWRKLWNQGDFPFYFVQLAPYRYSKSNPPYKPYILPEIWEAQFTSLSIPNTGMAVVTDTVDNIMDIHPKNKQDVGYRLALWALAKTYGQKDLVCSGPLYKTMKIECGKIRISFNHIGSGLASRDGKPLDFFEIAGADKNFVKAKAVIDGTAVVVSSESVAEPKAVRFGWNQEAQPNLINKEGLPASPFRTDQW